MIILNSTFLLVFSTNRNRLLFSRPKLFKKMKNKKTLHPINKLIGILLILLLSISMMSCQIFRLSAENDSDKKAEFREKLNKTNYRLKDIPVPRKFKLITKKSFLFESTGTRAGNLVYVGEDNYVNVINFYKDNMHSYGWSMVRTFEQKSTLMTFQKKGWIAHIHVQPEDSLVQIDVSIGPDEKIKK
ncbi:MAG: hypothetical protein CMH79_01510 [Nitrospinae bacterium]|nr:hypothetical protein [Nitrospinota bacterium]